MGHVRSYSIGDAHARFRRARGDAVLYSLGFDAFGLPAELGALENGLPPREWVDACAAQMRDQFDSMGFSFDWSREFISCDEDIYKWSQWLFLVLLEGGFIYEREGSVDWCESCKTVLARQQAEGGQCWRCHGPVQLVRRSQWYVRGSAYAEENDRRLADLTHWNKGRDRRAALRASAAWTASSSTPRRSTAWTLTLFTPHEQALATAEFALLSPNHPDIDRWTSSPEVREQLAGLRDAGWQRDDRKLEEVAVVGTHLSVFAARDPAPAAGADLLLGRRALRADRGARHPVRGYRTDKAIFAQLRRTHRPARRAAPRRRLARSKVDAAGDAAGEALPRRRLPDLAPARVGRSDPDRPLRGLRDWVPVPLDQLPVRLPRGPRGHRRGQRAAGLDRPDFLECECPSCGGPARRETDTLDCHFDAASQEFPLPGPDGRPQRGVAAHPPRARSAGSRSSGTSTAPTPATSSWTSGRSRRCCATSATSTGCRTASATGGPSPTRWCSSTGGR